MAFYAACSRRNEVSAVLHIERNPYAVRAMQRAVVSVFTAKKSTCIPNGLIAFAVKVANQGKAPRLLSSLVC
jgi:hypothetical protein